MRSVVVEPPDCRQVEYGAQPGVSWCGDDLQPFTIAPGRAKSTDCLVTIAIAFFPQWRTDGGAGPPGHAQGAAGCNNRTAPRRRAPPLTREASTLHILPRVRGSVGRD